MDSAALRENGRQLIDYIAQYHEKISERPVVSSVEPGYMRKLIPIDPPDNGEDWNAIMKGIEEVIMPGTTHWTHPHYHGFFPNGFSFISVLADVLCDGIANVGFSWVASPATTELETITLEWLGQMIGLPAEFLTFPEHSKGGSVLQNSGGDCNFVCLLTARSDKIKQMKENGNEDPPVKIATRLVAYCSKEAHYSVHKSAKLGLVQLRILNTDDEYRLNGKTLDDAIENDLKQGLHPFFVVATLGSLSCSSCDLIKDIGPVCAKHKIWLHVDATYAGNALICPENRHMLEGIEHVMSFAMDPTKWLPIIIEGAAMWVRDKKKVTDSFVVDPLYLQYEHSKDAIDYRHWGVHLSRRNRGLKYWFTIRYFGRKALEDYIRNHINLAKTFEQLVKTDDRFEVKNKVAFGLVCFRLKGDNDLSVRLLKAITDTKKLFLKNASLKGCFIIQFCIGYQHSSDKEINEAWKIIQECAGGVLSQKK